MGKKRTWNDKIAINLRERRKRDPLYQFSNNVFYTQWITNGIMAEVNNLPLKADRYGVFHGTSL